MVALAETVDSGRRPRKALITYSRKRIEPLRLTGDQFLIVSDKIQPLSKHADVSGRKSTLCALDEERKGESEPNDERPSRQRLPRTHMQAQLHFNPRRKDVTKQERPKRRKSGILVNELELVPYSQLQVDASPPALSDIDHDDHDTISDSPLPELARRPCHTVLSRQPEHKDKSFRPISVAVLRKRLRPTRTSLITSRLKPGLQPRLPSTKTKSRSYPLSKVHQGRDGFTTSELIIPVRDRKRTRGRPGAHDSRVEIKGIGKLKLGRGLLPEVCFMDVPEKDVGLELEMQDSMGEVEEDIAEADRRCVAGTGEEIVNEESNVVDMGSPTQPGPTYPVQESPGIPERTSLTWGNLSSGPNGFKKVPPKRSMTEYLSSITAPARLHASDLDSDEEPEEESNPDAEGLHPQPEQQFLSDREGSEDGDDLSLPVTSDLTAASTRASRTMSKDAILHASPPSILSLNTDSRAELLEAKSSNQSMHSDLLFEADPFQKSENYFASGEASIIELADDDEGEEDIFSLMSAERPSYDLDAFSAPRLTPRRRRRIPPRRDLANVLSTYRRSRESSMLPPQPACATHHSSRKGMIEVPRSSLIPESDPILSSAICLPRVSGPQHRPLSKLNGWIQ